MRRTGRVTCFVLALGAALLWCCDAQLLPHQRLGVSPNAPPADLKRAYRKRCLELHPDKHQGEAKKAWAEQEFMALGKAYETMLADAVRRHQGAGSRPTRAGAGAGAGGGGERGDQQQQSRPRSDDSRQTAADHERAERHRREQERRAQRRESAKGSGRDRGDGQWSERTTADSRRQREREREFRRLQEEERRWQEQARRRQEQHQQRQHQEQQQRQHFFRHDGEDAQDARLRAEREQLERDERHRRERMRRQGGGKKGEAGGRGGTAGQGGGARGGGASGEEERGARLTRQLHELAGSPLVAFSIAEEGAWAAIGHTLTHLLYVEAMPTNTQPVSAVSIPLSRVKAVKTGSDGMHVQIQLAPGADGVRQAPLQVVVGHHDEAANKTQP
jgi:curved DNA-binding protein CbpA